MTVSTRLQSVSSRAMRIMYRSVGLHGEPIAVTGFLLVPAVLLPAEVGR